jgi:steroid 5-alpha reductase family enzyme
MILQTLLVCTGVSALIQFLLWRVATRKQNAGWVDFGWSFGMAMGGLCVLLMLPFHFRSLVVSLMIMCWGGRLASHILFDRLLKGKPEDERYVNLRKHWGEHADRNFFFFFVGQALLVALFITPATVVATRGGSFPDVWDLLGIAVAILAVGGEALADHQLAVFRADASTKGTVCRRGLWKYSRHPNYFFEWMHWFSYVFMGVGAGYWALTWIGPVMMYVFLRYITGIPHAERQSLRSRGDAYKEYQNTTSEFFPWIPQKR